MTKVFIYKVHRLAGPIKIDADWSKTAWQSVKSAEIKNHMGTCPEFFPIVKSKMMYDNENLYLIFNVRDRYVRCITTDINGPVWEDGCIEFFFSPDTGFPEKYFNLEINCGGTPLMHYNLIPREKATVIDPSDIKNIEIAHTLPTKVDPEIKESVRWTVEYRIPLNIVRKYSNITDPVPGVEWKANFFKIAENNSNPHYLTWTVVNNPVPDFHLPQFFGKIKFI
jgi:hypothetical protein